jgi:hypothetical protein
MEIGYNPAHRRGEGHRSEKAGVRVVTEQTLTDVEQKVLDVLRAVDGSYVDFYFVETKTGFQRWMVRWACRRLAHLGLASYGRGIVDRNGRYCGAGYCAG